MPRSSSPFLSTRALGLGVVALALIAGMVVLGLWQLGVYDDHRDDDAQVQLARAEVPLSDVLGPDDAFPSDGVSRPVTVTGSYQPTQQFVVRNGDTLGVDQAVVTPLRVSNGSIVLVVRGRGGVGAAAPTDGPVTVTGVLEPSDSAGEALGDGRTTDGIRIAALVQDFEQDLYAGYVVLTSSDPADSLPPVPPPRPDASSWAGVRNLVYGIQWWLFAGFVAFMWWRIVTEPDRDDDTARPARTAVG